MRRHLLCAISLTAAWSCTSEPAVPAAQKAQEAKKQAARSYRLSYANPEAVDSSTTWRYQQVGWASKEGRSRFALNSSGDSYSSYDSGNAFNIIFFSPGSADAHLLLPHSRYRITQIDTKAQPLARWPYIFYTAIIADSDQDQELNSEDLHALLASDRQGRNVQQITPDTASVASWQVAPPYLLVALRIDSNRNHRFEQIEDVQWTKYDLRNLRAAPVPLLTPGLRQQLQQQLIDHRVSYPDAD